MPNSIEFPESEQESFRKYCRQRLSIQKEFIKLRHVVLATAEHEGKEMTHRQVFELLNKLHFNVTGKYRFENYELFLIVLIRLEHQGRRQTGKDNTTTFN
jgi:hypothetical protein